MENSNFKEIFEKMSDKDKQTIKDEINKNDNIKRIFDISKKDFIDKHGSGTLRKNSWLGFACNDQYIEERVAYEFGWEFQRVMASRVTFGIPISDGDCPISTEAGWHTERYINIRETEDEKFGISFIQYENYLCEKIEGVGIRVLKTKSSMKTEATEIFAMIAEFNVETKEWAEALNPF